MNVLFYLFGLEYGPNIAFDGLIAHSRVIEPLLAFDTGEIWAVSFASGIPAKVAEYRDQPFWTWEVQDDGKKNMPGWYHPVRGGRNQAMPFNAADWIKYAQPKSTQMAVRNITRY